MKRTKYNGRVVGVHAVRSAVRQPAAPDTERIGNASGEMRTWDKDRGLDVAVAFFVVVSALAIYMTRRTLAIVVPFLD